MDNDKLKAALIGARDAMREASKQYSIAADHYCDAVDAVQALPPQPAVASVTVEELAGIIHHEAVMTMTTAKIIAEKVLARLNITPAEERASAQKRLNEPWPETDAELDKIFESPAPNPPAPAGEKGRTLAQVNFEGYWSHPKICNEPEKWKHHGAIGKEGWALGASAVVEHFVCGLSVDQFAAVVHEADGTALDSTCRKTARAIIAHLKSLASAAGKEAGSV